MSHTNLIIDADPHFSIDVVTRKIRNESSKKVALIQNDHNSERFTFDLPRFIEEHDMMECDRVEVHFLNIGTNKEENPGVYEVDDMQVHPEDETKIAFSWLLSAETTKHVGSLVFLIRLCCTGTDDVAEYVWHTARNTDISISEGMNNAESVVERYPDILAQWEERIFGAAGDAVENINTAKNTAIAESVSMIDEVGDRWAGAVETAGQKVIETIEDKNNQLANAVKATASGEVIRVDDVSPVEHIAKVKVRGKNLFNAKTIEPLAKGDLYVSAVEDGSITITSTENYVGNGFAGINKTLRDLCPQITAGKEYVLNATTPSNVKAIFLVGKSLVWQFGTGRLLTDELLNCNVVFYGYDSTIYGYGDCVISNIQMEEGTTATKYEPYINPETVTVTRYGTDESDNLETFTPDASGFVDIPSLSPTMTLLTDTAGVNIELVYNQDTNVAMDNVKKDLAEADRVIAKLSEDMGDVETALDGIIAIQNELLGVSE